MQIRNSFLLLLFTFCWMGIMTGQKTIKTGSYLAKVHKKGGERLLYRILYPEGFDTAKSYPLVVFLHGVGERGEDNKIQLAHGSQLFKDAQQDHPAIVIFPQCPEEDYWAKMTPSGEGDERIFNFGTGEPTPALALVMDLMKENIAKKYIDEERVYVGGLSMGGMGVWELLWRIPEKIAAAIPICGGGAIEKAKSMVQIPIWAFHGAQDRVVKASYSIEMIQAIEAAGGKAILTLYPEATHNSWDTTFAEPDLLNWLFSQQKAKE